MLWDLKLEAIFVIESIKTVYQKQRKYIRNRNLCPLAPDMRRTEIASSTSPKSSHRIEQLSLHRFHTSVCISLAFLDTEGQEKRKTQQLTGLNTIACIWLTKLIGRPRSPNCKSSWTRFSLVKRTQEKGASYIAKERAKRMVVAVSMCLKRNPVSWMYWIAGSGETCCSCWSWRAWGAWWSPGLVGNAGGSDPDVDTWLSPAYL